MKERRDVALPQIAAKRRESIEGAGGSGRVSTTALATIVGSAAITKESMGWWLGDSRRPDGFSSSLLPVIPLLTLLPSSPPPALCSATGSDERRDDSRHHYPDCHPT